MKILRDKFYAQLIFNSAQQEPLERLVAVLQAEIKEWKTRYEVERARAERAIDAQLAVRGFPVVTPREGMPDLPDALEEDPEKVAELEKRLLQGDATVFTEPR